MPSDIRSSFRDNDRGHSQKKEKKGDEKSEKEKYPTARLSIQIPVVKLPPETGTALNKNIRELKGGKSKHRSTPMENRKAGL